MFDKIEIPWQQLSDDALSGVIEEFVLREGTEYGWQDVSLENKVEQVKAQLREGGVLVVFDEEMNCTNIISKDDWVSN